jgi:hypothetical protein
MWNHTQEGEEAQKSGWYELEDEKKLIVIIKSFWQIELGRRLETQSSIPN